MSNEKFKPPYTSHKSLSPKLVWNKSRIKLNFKGSIFLKWNEVTFTSNNAVNWRIVYELVRWWQDLKSALKDCLFGNVKITKNADPDKYSHSGYGIVFDSHSLFLIPKFDCGKNIITFGVDMSSSVHTDDK